jgi:outer membrane protein
MKNYFLAAFLTCAALNAAAADIKEISLEQCQRDALSNSYQIRQLNAQAAGAQANVKAAQASYYPSISLDAKGSWVSHVPSLTLGPAGAMEFGDNRGYQAGATLEYILFDYGARGGASKSAQAAAQAALQEARFAQKTLVLETRRAYFAVQQDLENMYFMATRLKVAQKQLHDVQAAFKAGAKSNLDVSLAQKQQAAAQINISAARAALGAHLRELFKLTNNNYAIDAAYPADWRIEISKEDLPATAIIKADKLEDTISALNPNAKNIFDRNSAKLAAIDYMAQYYEQLAKSVSGALYPSIAVAGGAYFEYPDGPIKDHVFLGRAGVSVRIPLFENTGARAKAGASRLSAQAAQYQKLSAQADLENIFYASQSMLYSLDLQAALAQKMIDAGARAADLTYRAYKAGSVTFLDVDSANLSLLESKIALSSIYAQRLASLAVLDALGTGPADMI